MSHRLKKKKEISRLKLNWVSPFLKEIAGLAKRRLSWRAKPWTATSFIATKPPPGRPCWQSSANSLAAQRTPAIHNP